MISTQIVFFVPFAIIDYFRLFQKYRIQKSKYPSKAKYFSAAKLYLLNLFLQWVSFIGITKALNNWNAFKYIGIRSNPIAPSFQEMIIQLSIFLILDDLWFYFYHRVFHEIPYLYIKFHKIHHQFYAPFALSSTALHPVELLMQGVGFFIGPLIFKPHLITIWLWFIVRQAIGYNDHTGYELPWNPLDRLYPLIGSSKFHDLHHEKNIGNYASVFPVIDKIFGTEYQ